MATRPLVDHICAENLNNFVMKITGGLQGRSASSDFAAIKQRVFDVYGATSYSVRQLTPGSQSIHQEHIEP